MRRAPPVLFIVACIIVLSAGYALLWRMTAHELPKLRIGISPWPGYEFVYLAAVKGFFREEGLDVQIVQFSSPDQDVRTAFEQGKIDGMCNTIPDSLQVLARTGRVPKIVLVTDYSAGADVIIAKSPLKSVSELKGKRIALETLSLGPVILAHALRMNGLSLEDIHMLNFSQDEMGQALREDKTDAIITYPPISGEILEMQDVSVIFDSSAIPGEIVDIVALGQDITDRHPGIADNFRRAWAKALDFVEKNPDEAYGLMAAREGISPEEFKASLDGIHIVSSTGQEKIMAPDGSLERTVAATAEALKAMNILEDSVEEKKMLLHLRSEEKQ